MLVCGAKCLLPVLRVVPICTHFVRLCVGRIDATTLLLRLRIIALIDIFFLVVVVTRGGEKDLFLSVFVRARVRKTKKELRRQAAITTERWIFLVFLKIVCPLEEENNIAKRKKKRNCATKRKATFPTSRNCNQTCGKEAKRNGLFHFRFPASFFFYVKDATSRRPQTELEAIRKRFLGEKERFFCGGYDLEEKTEKNRKLRQEGKGHFCSVTMREKGGRGENIVLPYSFGGKIRFWPRHSSSSFYIQGTRARTKTGEQGTHFGFPKIIVIITILGRS